jgi:hypothetical protein
MSALNFRQPTIGARVRGLRKIGRFGGTEEALFRRACVDTEIGQRLGIAALYGGRGEADAARVTALLACAGLDDTPDNRAAIASDMGAILSLVTASAGPQARAA